MWLHLVVLYSYLHNNPHFVSLVAQTCCLASMLFLWRMIQYYTLLICEYILNKLGMRAYSVSRHICIINSLGTQVCCVGVFWVIFLKIYQNFKNPEFCLSYLINYWYPNNPFTWEPFMWLH